MVDLHHHLLFGLDDGSPDLETSLAMVRMAAADGVTHIVATPHSSNRYGFDPVLVAQRLAELRTAAAAESLPVELASGCDFHMSYDNLQDAQLHPRKYTLHSTEYLLIELPDHGISTRLNERLYELRLAGMVPILTHPERNPTLQHDPKRLREWLADGLLVQITTSSVVGDMGKQAERMAHDLLRDNCVHFLASDAHDLKHRTPRMSPARDAVASRYGAATAERLCVTNPLAVFEGRPLPAQPEMRGVFEERNTYDMPWWRRLLRA